jgi:hypothetical protein
MRYTTQTALLLHGHHGKSLRSESGAEGIRILAQEMVERIVSWVRAALPAVAIRNAKRDETSRMEASVDLGNESSVLKRSRSFDCRRANKAYRNWARARQNPPFKKALA